MERERERDRYMYIYIYIYTHIVQDLREEGLLRALEHGRRRLPGPTYLLML